MKSVPCRCRVHLDVVRGGGLGYGRIGQTYRDRLKPSLPTARTAITVRNALLVADAARKPSLPNARAAITGHHTLFAAGAARKPSLPGARAAITRHVAILLLTLLAAATLLPSCKVRTEDQSLDRILSAAKLRVGVDPSYPPFAGIDEQGRPYGFEIDLAGELARRVGVAPDLVSMDVGGIVDALIAKKIDVVIAGLPPATEYEKQVAYSRPYFNAGQVLVTAAGGHPSLADLQGRRVGVESGSGADLALRSRIGQITLWEIKSYTSAEVALADLLPGRLDAVATDVITAREYVHRAPPGLAVAGEPFTEEPYVIAARRPDRALLQMINKSLDMMIADGYLAQLEKRWLP